MDKILKKLKRKEKQISLGLPIYSVSEEVLNSISHALGVLFSIFAIIFLIFKYSYDLKSSVCMLIYGITLFVLYIGSTLYHSFKVSKFKGILRKFDHCSIFLLIAGTYTPICGVYLNSLASNIVLISVWVMALLGIIINIIDINKFSKISFVLYILMGWSVAFISKSVFESISTNQLLMLLFGGILYTLGAGLYLIGKKIRYIHSIWHLFVLGGSVLQFLIFI